MTTTVSTRNPMYRVLVQTVTYPSDFYFTEPMPLDKVRDQYDLSEAEREELLRNGSLRTKRTMGYDKHPHHITITKETS